MTKIVVALVLLLKAFNSTSLKDAELLLSESVPEKDLETFSNLLVRARKSIGMLEALVMRVRLTKAPLPNNLEVN